MDLKEKEHSEHNNNCTTWDIGGTARLLGYLYVEWIYWEELWSQITRGLNGKFNISTVKSIRSAQTLVANVNCYYFILLKTRFLRGTYLTCCCLLLGKTLCLRDQNNPKDQQPQFESFLSITNRIIRRVFAGPSSVQALGISQTYYFPLSVWRAASILPSLVGGFQALHSVAPILLNERSTDERSSHTSLVEFWQIWVIFAWVISLISTMCRYHC